MYVCMYVSIHVFLRKSITLQPWLVSVYTKLALNSEKSLCCGLLSAEITGVSKRNYIFLEFLEW